MTFVYVWLVWLTMRWLRGGLGYSMAEGAALLSGAWLMLTLIVLPRLLRTYFDVLSRLQVLLPLLAGCLLSALSVVQASGLPLRLAGCFELLGWMVVFLLYQDNRKNYFQQGSGPLPIDCLVNPPVALIEPLDLVLMSGLIARRLKESVGHMEVVIRLEDGRLGTFTSRLNEGAVIRDLEERLAAELEGGDHYIVLKLAQRPAPELILQATKIARQLTAKNAAWRIQQQAARGKFINRMPLPERWRKWLSAKRKITGYDFKALYTGLRSGDRWTCVGACLEVYHRLGIETQQLNTGLFGTGLFDPIGAVRLMQDPLFRLVTVRDAGTNLAATDSLPIRLVRERCL